MVSVANTDIDNKGKCVDLEERKKKEGKHKPTLRPGGRSNTCARPARGQTGQFCADCATCPGRGLLHSTSPFVLHGLYTQLHSSTAMSTAVCTLVTLHFHGAYQVVPCFQRTCDAVLVVGSLD